MANNRKVVEKMSHNHTIKDTDLHFIIDPITRTIESQSEKRYMTQLDHESERLTFGVQRFIEEHDMSLCDRIEIHYTNITKKKDATSEGIYIVKDLDKSFTNDQFLFSWLVRRESTMYAGTLRFSITFLCRDDEENITYEWSTTEYKSIQILPKLNHTASIAAKYPDLYAQMKQEIIDELSKTVDIEIDPEELEQIVQDYLQANPPTLITVDEVLSTESTNPVQNKVVTNAINDLKVMIGNAEALLETI